MPSPLKETFEIVRTVSDLRARVLVWQNAGQTIGYVPTMGGLHEGHLSLVRQSLAQTDRTIATIFVNPKQFSEGEDFESYPRDETRDAKLFADTGAHLLYAPDGDEMYPAGFTTSISMPGIGDRLEGEFRPGFFTGVATVVAKLLLQVGADQAFFGEKDYQQLQVIHRMVQDLNIPTEVVGVPTVREDDGLALSSRNVYLTPEERKIAPTLYQTIKAVAAKVKEGDDIASTEAWGMAALRDAGFAMVDYVAVRDGQTLELINKIKSPARVLAAAWLGKARLIDNVPV